MASARRAVFSDLAVLPERPHSEIIHGVIVPKAAPAPEHGFTQNNLIAWASRRFGRPLGGRWPGGWWIGVEIHVQYEPHEVYCHDAVGWRREGGDRPTGWPVATRPDWVCEILSPNHEKHDLVDKLWALHGARVPHYWVIDREELTLSIFRWESGGYLMLPPIRSGGVVRAEPFDDVELKTAILFGDEPDEE